MIVSTLVLCWGSNTCIKLLAEVGTDDSWAGPVLDSALEVMLPVKGFIPGPA